MFKCLVLGCLCALVAGLGACGTKPPQSMPSNGPSTSTFTDRNGNGRLDVYEDESRPRAERVANLLSKLSPAQKVSLVSGIGYAMDPKAAQKHKVPGAAGFTVPIESLGIPSIVLADGPAGARIWPDRDGTDQTFYATAFPIETVLSSSWDIDLLEDVGRAFGEELKEYGIDILLAPGMNIHRDPRGGRNFEYYSEDPLLSGRMAAAMVSGVQKMGVGATPKHYVANNQETNRYKVDTVVGERALREIYLRGFRIAIEESDPWAIMSAYNKVNGTSASQDESLMTTVLRDEWGFHGVVMTDWFAGMDDPVSQMNAGNELLMPGVAGADEQLLAALDSGDLSLEQLDRNVSIILDVVMRAPAWQGYAYSNKPDLAGNAAVARRAAAEGVVLLKNENNALPMSDSVKTAAVFGNQSYDFISGGTGSGDVNEAYTISLVEALEQRGVSVDPDLRGLYDEYLREYAASLPPKERFWEFTPPPPEQDLEDVLIERKAQSADIALITIGRNSGEFQDRPIEGDFYLTAAEKRLIQNVSSAFQSRGKQAIVILNIGNVVETHSWRDTADAIVVPWQGGQEAGNALVDVLTGDVNPSAKLPTTFPMDYEDTPTHQNFPGTRLSEDSEIVLGIFETYESEVKYEEGIYVGYRYYDTADKAVAYPFGYGLSYTTFDYHDITLSNDVMTGELVASVEVRNSGQTEGREVVQLYVSAPDARLDMPRKELRGFAKTAKLAPGESEELKFKLSAQDIASFDEARKAWVAAAGEYTVSIGASSRDLRGQAVFKLEREVLTETVIADLSPEKSLEELEL